MPELENIDYVICQICGEKKKSLQSHLIRLHKISTKDYLEKYPNSHLTAKCVGVSVQEAWKKGISPYSKRKLNFPEDSIGVKFPSILEEWDYENNTISPYEISPGINSRKIHLICKKCGNKYQKTPHKYAIGQRCNGCGTSFKVVNKTNNFGFLYPHLLNEWNYELNTKSPYELTPKARQYVFRTCSKCGHIWETLLYGWTNGRTCPACNESKKVATPINNFATNFPELLNEWDYDKNIISPTSITSGSNKYVWRKCKDCGNSWETAIYNWKNLWGCPKCSNRSRGETKIGNFLDLNKVLYETEKTYVDCKSIHVLPFDFYLPDYNILIEYDGQQHYETYDYYDKNNENRLEKQQARDKIKTEYCLANNIKLIRIPYWDYDNIEEILSKELNIEKK